MGRTHPGDRIEVVLQLSEKRATLKAGRFVTRDELESNYCAKKSDADLVRAFARHFDLEIFRVDLGKRLIRLRGAEKLNQLTKPEH